MQDTPLDGKKRRTQKKIIVGQGDEKIVKHGRRKKRKRKKNVKEESLRDRFRKQEMKKDVRKKR